MVLIVEKVPREGPVPDVGPSFPPLTGLRLELLEDKNKLKEVLPPETQEEEEEEKEAEVVEEPAEAPENEGLEKEEYIWRFRILRKQYGPEASIPEWNEHSDLQLMKTSYERTIRELHLDDTVESAKTWLLGGWLLVEYVCTQWAGIDLRGFTLKQTKMTHKYDRLMVELGERSYASWGEGLPIEVRLLGTVVFQAGIFFLAKEVAERFGGTPIAEIFKFFTGENTASDIPQAQRRGKLKGPRAKVDETEPPPSLRVEGDGRSSP